MPATANCLDAGLDYLRRRWSAIPIIAKSKRPMVPWTPFQEKAPTAEQLKGWFATRPDANIGIVTGAVSGLVVLDIDVGHGGADSLAGLEAHYRKLPPTVEAETGGGGRHFYFRHPGGMVRNRAGIAPGIDLRGDGGMIVAPPSVHPSGRRYRWADGRAPGETALAAMPDWLLRRARAGDERTAGGGHPLAHWRRLVREGVGEGQRNNSIASLAGHLLWRGVDPAVALDLLLCWNRERCRPSLDDDEVAQVVDSIARLHEREAREASAQWEPDRGER
jgi:hypothetical protein